MTLTLKTFTHTVYSETIISSAAGRSKFQIANWTIRKLGVAIAGCSAELQELPNRAHSRLLFNSSPGA